MKTILCGLLVVVVSFTSQIRAESNASETSAFVRDFYAAYRAKDVARMAQFYAANATFVDPSFELNLKGPDQIRELLRKRSSNMNRLIGKSRTRLLQATTWWWRERWSDS